MNGMMRAGAVFLAVGAALMMFALGMMTAGNGGPASWIEYAAGAGAIGFAVALTLTANGD